MEDPAGNFYGTTTAGGDYNNGCVFRMTPAGLISTLYSFRGGSDGGYPAAALLLGSDGNFYGTTAYGGDYGDGTLFRMTPSGLLTTLVAFDGYAGANAQAALVEDADGSLVGTTQNGGASDAGVIFRLSFSGPPQLTAEPVSQTVYAGEDVVLSVAVSGSQPFSYQWQKNGTNLPGSVRVLTLTSVTTNDAGVYSVLVSNPDGSTNSVGAFLTVLSSPPVIIVAPTNQTPTACTTVSFNVAAVGNKPLSYQWQKNGVNLADSCYLSGSTTTTLVISNVTEADNGTYTAIVTNPLGSTNVSAVLSLVPKTALCTSLTTRHWFGGGNDGGTPNGLSLGTNGLLYGTTQFGGAWNLGTVFTLDANGVYTTLASFSGTNGASPYAAPVQGADGYFYGTTFQGGAYNKGTVIAMTPGGTLTDLHSFTGVGEGASPAAALIQGADGRFYGTTSAGGLSDYGTVFGITASGTLTNLHSFTGGVDGKSPAGALVPGCDGGLYGLTSAGGAYDRGTVFRITPEGAFSILYSFTGGSDGYSPAGTLALGSDCNFYGVTRYYAIAGHQAYGTVFKVTPAGALTTLYRFGNFSPPDGVYPVAGVVQNSDGNLYGTTYYTNSLGGASGYGTVFRVSPDGSTFATLLSFDGCNDGAHPQAALVEDTAGNLYGTTSTGGPCQASQGTLFRLGVGCAPQITDQPVSQAAVVGANVQLGVAITGARPFFYQWKRNGTNLLDGGNVFGSTNRSLTLTSVSLADTATYSVSLSNSLGSATSTLAHVTVVRPPVFLSAVRTNCTLALTWSAMPGQRYRLQYKSTLAATNWTYLGGSVYPTSNTVTATDNVCTNTQRVYRVVLFPQIL